MRTINHKNIIVEKYHDKQQVLKMYDLLIQRKKEKGNDCKATFLQRDKIKKQLEMLQDKFPEYLI